MNAKRRIIKSRQVESKSSALRAILYVLGATIFVSVISVGAVYAVTTWNDVKENWELENACIAHLISLEIERSDIVRIDGGCTIKGVE